MTPKTIALTKENSCYPVKTEIPISLPDIEHDNYNLLTIKIAEISSCILVVVFSEEVPSSNPEEGKIIIQQIDNKDYRNIAIVKEANNIRVADKDFKAIRFYIAEGIIPKGGVLQDTIVDVKSDLAYCKFEYYLSHITELPNNTRRIKFPQH